MKFYFFYLDGGMDTSNSMLDASYKEDDNTDYNVCINFVLYGNSVYAECRILGKSYLPRFFKIIISLQDSRKSLTKFT